MSMHADKVVAAAETYIGLVEFGVGVIPGGGGSKEMTLRAADNFHKNRRKMIVQAHADASAYCGDGAGCLVWQRTMGTQRHYAPLSVYRR